MKLTVELKFEPRDLWLGAYFDSGRDRLYVCVLPCFPIVMQAESEAPYQEGTPPS